MRTKRDYGNYKKWLFSNINDLLVYFYSFYSTFYNEGPNYKNYKNPLGFIVL